MTVIKKLMAAGVLCSVFLTGCGMPDKVADMIGDMPITMLSTSSEIFDTQLHIHKEADWEEKSWVLDKSSQQQLRELRDFLKSEEKKGTLAPVDDGLAEIIEKWAEAKDKEDVAFRNREMGRWHISIPTKEKLLDFFKELEAHGYTGGYDLVSNNMEQAAQIQGEAELYLDADISFVSNKVVFKVTFDGCDDSPYAYVQISMSPYHVKYPASLGDILKNKLQNGFTVQYIKSEGYLQAVEIFAAAFGAESPYSKDGIIYLKDGKLLQIDMYIQQPEWFVKREEEGIYQKGLDVFFTEAEAKTFAGLLEMFGVNNSDALAFTEKVGRDSGSKGTIGDVSWQLAEDALAKNGAWDKNWLLRIQ